MSKQQTYRLSRVVPMKFGLTLAGIPGLSFPGFSTANHEDRTCMASAIFIQNSCQSEVQEEYFAENVNCPNKLRTAQNPGPSAGPGSLFWPTVNRKLIGNPRSIFIFP